MLSRSRRMPFTYSLFLSVVAATTAARADTPFFWDDFDREVLEAGDVHWESNSTYLEDGSLIVHPADDEGVVHVQANIPPLRDFSIRTQINFDGTEFFGPEPWFGPWFSEPGLHYWGGVNTNGYASIGTGNSNPNPVNTSTPCRCNFDFALDHAETYERDINLQYDAVGERIELFAWFDGSDKPAEPQVTVDNRTQFDSTAFGFTLNRTVVENGVIIPDQRGAVRYYAVLPAVAGDFSASDALDLEDILLMDQELRGESKNRVFDLNEDVLVTGEDRRILIQDLMATSFGDSNLDGSVNSADLNNLALNWQSPTTTNWALGDFTGDGNTDAADLNLLALNWRSGQQAAISAASVPEPASALLLVVSLVMGISNFRYRHG